MKQNKRIQNRYRIFKRAQKYLLGLFICLLFPGVSFGFDFSEVRESLKSDIVTANGNVLKTTIAIVYNNKHREAVKKKVNLVNFKKELSTELVRSFKVVDPILVGKVLEINKISYQSLLKNADYMRGLSRRLENTHVLFVDMTPQSKQLSVNMQLLTSQGQVISKVFIEVPLGQKNAIAAPAAEEAVSTTETADDEDESLLNRLRDNFSPSSFVDGHNESFIYFTPTAYVQPETHSVDILTWMKDVRNVELAWMRLKYDFKFAERFQAGVQVNGIAEKKSANEDPNDDKEMGHHSTYASLKYLIMDDSQLELPLAIAAGIKTRLLWDNDNTDFDDKDDDKEDRNKSQNRLTLFLSASGKIDKLGLLYNFYLDNQQFGTGAKFLLTPDVKIFFDNVYYYYDGAPIDDDQAIGIQFYAPAGTVFTLAHQTETRQTQVGIGVNW